MFLANRIYDVEGWHHRQENLYLGQVLLQSTGACYQKREKSTSSIVCFVQTYQEDVMDPFEWISVAIAAATLLLQAFDTLRRMRKQLVIWLKSGQILDRRVGNRRES